ncbi:MAG TPA: hypothetical protein VGK33_13615 [Chloroflexota bacterium]
MLRHAEKPDPDDHNKDLSKRGYHRAGALAALFGRLAPVELSNITRIFAADDTEHSWRCYETMKPTADVLGLDIKHHLRDDEYKRLASEILAMPHEGNALVCWHHQEIPNLARALGADLPDSVVWRGETFDRIWKLTLGGGGPVRVRDMPQRLLSHDSDGEAWLPATTSQ